MCDMISQPPALEASGAWLVVSSQSDCIRIGHCVLSLLLLTCYVSRPKIYLLLTSTSPWAFQKSPRATLQCRKESLTDYSVILHMYYLSASSFPLCILSCVDHIMRNCPASEEQESYGSLGLSDSHPMEY
nr:hypothetical protein Itr_chr07CG13120 [Ipomoea trifida]